MATKREDILALLDKAIGKKGPLRLPAYWMREVLLKIMDWAEGLTPDVDVPTKVSELKNDASYATQSYVNASVKQIESNCKAYTDSAIASSITNVLNKEV